MPKRKNIHEKEMKSTNNDYLRNEIRLSHHYCPLV